MRLSIVALDAGGSAVKAVLATDGSDGAWQVIARVAEPISSPVALSCGGCEHNAAEWWEAAMRALRKVTVDTRRVDLITLCGQMQSLVLADADGNALRPALLYSDVRASQEATEIEQKVGVKSLVEQTANWKGAASLLPKLLWLQRHERGVLDRAKHLLLGSHDFIFYKLTGSAMTDPTNASTTGLLSAAADNLAWCTTLLTTVGLPESISGKLPTLAVGGDNIAHISHTAANALGIAKLSGCRVCHGAGDLAAVTAAALSGHPGWLYCYLGTSGWVATEVPSLEAVARRAFVVRHTMPDRSIIAAPTTTACGNLLWLRSLLFADIADDAAAFRAMDAAAAAAPPGSGALLYLPYLNGERCPVNAPTARACFIGLSSSSTRGHLCRAAFEGVAMAVRSLLPMLPLPAFSSGAAPALILVGGGGVFTTLAQILADVLQREIHVTKQPRDVAALGAVLIGASALGAVADEPLPSAPFTTSTRLYGAFSVWKPQPENAEVYDAAFEAYCELPGNLRDTFDKLALMRAIG